MSNNNIVGTDWTATEIALVVTDYFEMLALELAQKSFVKTNHNEALQKLTGRSHGSIEFKHQNISAVLYELGLPWISGYKPMRNYQRALLEAIERFLPQQFELLSSPVLNQPTGMAEPDELSYEAPPQFSGTVEPKNEELERLIRKFDPAARDERNRTLGKKGEELIFHSERTRLSRQNPNLAKKVRWISAEEGDGAGFDILSFDADGSERLLEVKTTVGHQTTPFFISSNEMQLSESKPKEFRLVRLYDFAKKPKVFELKPPLSESVLLKTAVFKAYFEL